MRELPKGWTESRLCDVCSVLSGYYFPRRLQGRSEGDLPFYKVRNISDTWKRGETLLDKADHYLDFGGVQEIRARPFPPGTTVLAKTGAAIGLNRRAMLRVPSLVDYNVIALVPKIDSMNPKYLYFFSCTLRLMEHAQAAKVPFVRKSDIEEILIPVAPLEEQVRIVDEIEKQFKRLDDASAALKRVRSNLKRYRVSVLSAACEGRLIPTEADLARKGGRDYEPADKLLQRILSERRARWEIETLTKLKAPGKPPKKDGWKQKYKDPPAPDTSSLPELPEGWCWARAEQVCEFITRGTTPSASKLFDSPNNVPFIKANNLTHTGRLDFSKNQTYIEWHTHEQELARSRVYPGDVLMNIVGPPLGKVSIVPDIHSEWNVNQAVAVFRTAEGIETDFLARLLMTDRILNWITQKAKATAGQFNLTLEICRDLPIPLAPEDEQKRIGVELDRQISNLERTGSLVDSCFKRILTLRQSILTAAFTGILVSQNQTDESTTNVLERIRALKERERIWRAHRPHKKQKKEAKAR